MLHQLQYVKQHINLEEESVAFLQHLGGAWFDATRSALHNAGLSFVEITKINDWPMGSENIALSTIHSAKGLEFDHIFLLGLNTETLPHGKERNDDEFLKLRRLLAMGICRARETVTLGTKPEDRSDVLDLLDPNTYEEIRL